MELYWGVPNPTRPQFLNFLHRAPPQKIIKCNHKKAALNYSSLVLLTSVSVHLKTLVASGALSKLQKKIEAT